MGKFSGSYPAANEAPHQARRRRTRQRLRLPLSVLTTILVILYFQFYLLPSYVPGPGASTLRLSESQFDRLNVGLQKCAEFNTPQVQYSFPVPSTRSNPRWNPTTGQNVAILLRNATLFDGEKVLTEPMDIVFSHGIIKSVSQSSDSVYVNKGMQVFDLDGKYVTPGLVDMHSHHLVEAWPSSPASQGGNEVNPATGPLTPMVRSLDSMKPWDLATKIIASGGVTSSLILPGSANIMGGEAYMVKNFMSGGPDGEEVVEEMLLEHGLPPGERRRFMKMACGENPSVVYSHTRMGNAWILRKQMARAQEMLEKQDAWCLSAAAAKEAADAAAIAALTSTISGANPGLVEQLELDSTIAILRGKMGVNIHCYETEDFEDMLLHSKEFGFRIQAFHHALSAWKVPEMIKASGQNITIATFAEFGLYKQEAYEANLWAGKILADHGVPVAYKSDHFEEEMSAKWNMFEAAVAHSFHLPEDLALQAVTSVPAKSLELEHRIGYALPGYDADLVVWNSHPLSIGATPLQVYIDGKATLDPEKVAKTMPRSMIANLQSKSAPKMRALVVGPAREELCRAVVKEGAKIIITGITTSFMDSPTLMISGGNLTLILFSGKPICFGPYDQCVSTDTTGTFINLQNGHILPGLTALSTRLGLAEIDTLDESADGDVSTKADVLDVDNVIYAKYGVHLEGRAFKRARYGGVTRAVTPPMMEGGLLGGVSTGIKTSEKRTILDGGIFQDDVALHFTIGQSNKESKSITSVSSAIAKLRKILFDNKGKDSVYGSAANGTLPVIAHVSSKYDIMQLIKIKKEHGLVNLVILGGSGAPAVADELAAANIPVILSPFRAGPEQWEKLDALYGPPLTKSSVQVLAEAGVVFGLAMGGMGDARIHDLAVEASWAAKYAGLSDREAVNLVSRNIEKILGIKVNEDSRDFVIYDGNPLEFGASVVLSVDGDDRQIMDCWPYTE